MDYNFDNFHANSRWYIIIFYICRRSSILYRNTFLFIIAQYNVDFTLQFFTILRPHLNILSYKIIRKLQLCYYICTNVKNNSVTNSTLKPSNHKWWHNTFLYITRNWGWLKKSTSDTGSCLQKDVREKGSIILHHWDDCGRISVLL